MWDAKIQNMSFDIILLWIIALIPVCILLYLLYDVNQLKNEHLDRQNKPEQKILDNQNDLNSI